MDRSSLFAIVKALGQVLPQDASIAVAEKTKFIYYQPSQVIDLKIKPGDSVKEGTLTLEALRKKEKIAQHVDSKPFGIPYYGVSSPIVEGTDNAEICITTIYPAFYYKAAPRLPRDNILMGKQDNIWVPVPLENIFFIESNNGKTLLYTKNGIYENKYCLYQLAEMLPQEHFICCHRAYIVNVNSILEIHPDFHSTFILIMKDSNRSRVPVSQKYANKFRRLMGI